MNVYLDMVGCRLNQSEIETMANQFRAAGHSIVGEPDDADLVVVNTCAVTSAAASDSRQKIRHAYRAGAKSIVVTGCWSTLAPDRALGLPGVSQVISNKEKDGLVAHVLGTSEAFDLEPVARQPLPGIHQRTRAFIKVQDGCDNRCTFCVTTLARGEGCSRTVELVLQDIHQAISGDVKEIVLTGVHLGSWGHDFSPSLHLSELIQNILRLPDLSRLRLSSLEPWDLREDFFDLWQDVRLSPHLHLPLQSGSATILRRMARKTTPETFASLVEAARKAAPDVAVTSDIIVGFPGETDRYFEESLDFVRAIGFASGHVFTYSSRPGTAAANFQDQIPQAVKKERSARMRAALADSSLAFRKRFLGKTMSVLWEASDQHNSDGWRLNGLTGNYLRVSAISATPRWNQFDEVRLETITEDGIAGRIVEE